MQGKTSRPFNDCLLTSYGMNLIRYDCRQFSMEKSTIIRSTCHNFTQQNQEDIQSLGKLPVLDSSTTHFYNDRSSTQQFESQQLSYHSASLQKSTLFDHHASTLHSRRKQCKHTYININIAPVWEMIRFVPQINGSSSLTQS